MKLLLAVRTTDRFRVGSIAKTFVAHAYASPDGARQIVVLVNGEPQNEPAEAAVNRALDAGLCA